MKTLILFLALICLTSAYRPNMRQRVLELKYNTDEEELAAEDNTDVPKNVPNMTELEQYGYYLMPPDVLAEMLEQVKSIFITKNEPIVSKEYDEASCYTLDDVQCEFKADEMPIVFVVDYEQEPGEYSMSIKHEDEDESVVMRRRLKTSDCESFNEVLKLFDRELSCELRDYAHVISIKHIG